MKNYISAIQNNIFIKLLIIFIVLDVIFGVLRALKEHKTNCLKIKVNDEKETIWCLDGEEFIIKNNEIVIKIDRNTSIMLPKTNIDGN